MSLSPQFLDELRVRTTLSALVGRSLKLQKAGREWKACCPFHNEKTPSFYVNDEKGFYHCFGCSAHGDAIRWLADARGLGFMDAVKELADAAGMAVPAPDPQARERAERAAGLHDVMAAAERWFVEQLGGMEGADARKYLLERGISEDVQRKFGLGFAPDSRARLKTALAGFGEDRLAECGLLVVPEEGERDSYDRFRNRLMIPIRDQRGRVIAFGGRILGAGEPKYLNSPDTPLFDKGRTLYNLDKAAPAARKANRVVVVEGYLDVIALDRAGVEEAVAPLGTALTEAQIERLWRISDAPLLCFDGDSAGQKAAARAARRALPLVRPGHTLGFVTLPAGQDPDDMVRSGAQAALLGALTRPTGLLQKLWEAELAECDVATPEGRAALRQRLADRAGEIADRYVREEYKQAFSDIFWENFGWGRKRVETVSAEIRESRAESRPFDHSVRRSILLGLSRYPDVLRDNHDLVDQLEFPDPHMRRWYEILSLAVFEQPRLDEDLVEEILASSSIEPIEKRDLQKDLAFSFFKKREPERGRRDLRDVIATLIAEREIERAIAAANAELGRQTEPGEWARQQSLIDERRRIRERIAAINERLSADAADDPAMHGHAAGVA